MQFPAGGASAIYYAPGGARLPFTRKGYDSNEFISPPGIDADLKRQGDGTYVLTFHKSLEKYYFSSGGLLTSEVDKNTNTISFQYTNNTLSQITDTRGRLTRFTYNGGKLTHISDSSSPARVYSFGYTNGLLTSYVDPKNFTTTYEYDASNRLTKITDPLGYQTKFGYGTTRAVTSLSRFAGNDQNNQPTFDTTTFSYDLSPANPAANACCRATVTDANTHTTTYDYKPDGRVVQVKDAKGHSRSTTYTSDANVDTYTKAGGGQFKFTYDQTTGEDLTQVDSLQSSSQTADLGGKILYKETGQHAHLPTCSLDVENHEVYFKYDVPGNITDVYLGATGNLATGGAGSPGTSSDCGTDPTGWKSHYTYGYGVGRGLVSSVTDGRGNVTTYGYDSAGQLTSITYPKDGNGNTLQTSVSYTYDSLSRVATMADGNGTTTFSYDALDRLTQISYPDGTSIVYAYDANGNLKQRNDAVGQTTFDYTTKNELKTRSSSGGTSQFAYDPVGNMMTLTETPAGGSSLTTTYTYDAVNVLSQVNEPGATQGITFQTDADDNRIQTTFPNGVVWHADYAPTGEMKRVWANKSDNSVTFFDYGYDYHVVVNGAPSGPKTSRIQLVTDNLAGGSPAPTTEYTYDAANRLTKAVTLHYTDTKAYLNKSFDYSYDDNSNLTKIVDGGAQDTLFDYNADNELICQRPTGTSFGCPDPIGTGQTRYGYDGNGSLSSTKTTAGTTFITNNAKNQMTNYGAAAGGGGGTTMTYGDANSTERATKGATSYSYDLLGLASEQTGTGSRTYYTRDDKAKLLGTRTSGGNYYYLTDTIGSVVAVTGPNGNRVGGDNYHYNPFGGLIDGVDPLQNAGLPNFRFAGGYFDPESKFLKFGTRYYDPSVARWTQQDSQKGQLSDPMSFNPYLYVNDDPVNSTDLSGRFSFGDVIQTVARIGLDAISCAVFGGVGAVVGALVGAIVNYYAPQIGAGVGAFVGSVVGCAVGVVISETNVPL